MTARSEVDVYLLGTPQVRVDGVDAELPKSRKARALLAMLALEPAGHTRTSLCHVIWPETSDPRADLRWALSKLRGVLGADAVVAAGDRVRLNPERVRVDTWALEQVLGDQEAAPLEDLKRYAERVTTQILDGFEVSIGGDFDLWLESRRQAMRRLQQRLFASLAERLEGRPDDALIFARRRLAIDPLNEAAIIALLKLSLTVGGRHRAQADLEQARKRYRDAGLPDADLIAAWRRLSAGTEPVAVAEPAVSPQAAPAEEPRGLPSKPSLAVLGFDDVTGEDTLLAEGIAVDLTGKLSRLKGLFVIARASARRFNLGTIGAAPIGAQLGVRYLVHGTVQRRSNRLRVTVDLIETEGGESVWSERFERAADDLFDVQDQIVDAIVASLEPQIEKAEIDRARLLPTDDLQAWECFHRALGHCYRFTGNDVAQALSWLDRALQLDPNFARAHACRSFAYFSKAFLLASDDPERDRRLALESARESVSLEPRDAFGHWSLARAQFLNRDHDAAMWSIDQALVTNPNYALGHYARGFIGVHAGVSNLVVGDLDMAQRLSPFDPMRFAMESARALALARMGEYELAEKWAVRSLTEPNAHFHIFAIAAVCLQLAGKTDQAMEYIQKVQQLYPGYSVATFEQSFPSKFDREMRMFREALLAVRLPAEVR